ncbi:hypothetical protein J2Y48_002238 [Mycoplana sp. BE70]|nr:hypothetical protein [Mycoplana sp. BE70]
MTGDVLGKMALHFGSRLSFGAARRTSFEWLGLFFHRKADEQEETGAEIDSSPIFICGIGRPVYVYPGRRNPSLHAKPEEQRIEAHLL